MTSGENPSSICIVAPGWRGAAPRAAAPATAATAANRENAEVLERGLRIEVLVDHPDERLIHRRRDPVVARRAERHRPAAATPRSLEYDRGRDRAAVAGERSRAPYALGSVPYDASLSLYKNPNPGVT